MKRRDSLLKGTAARKCKWCGATFLPLFSDDYHCSDVCREEEDDQVRHRDERMPSIYMRARILARDHYQCIYCGRSSIEHQVPLQVDHIIPFARGGRTTYGNLVTACRDCNMGKGQVPLEPDALRRVLDEIARRVANPLCEEETRG